MRIVYNSFHGRYSDSPRVVFERLVDREGLEHVWLVDPEHAVSFPSDARTVDIETREATAALEGADLLVANTHTEVRWSKPATTTYVQTWHGTPLKRIHRDVLWAPEGRLDRLDQDVAKWDLLVSPNPESTPRLRSGFRFEGEVVEIGYPRNDVLLSRDAPAIRDDVRAELGVPADATVVLYAPTWRDDEKFREGSPPVEHGLDVPGLTESLGPEHWWLVRTHPLMTGRTNLRAAPRVIDTSYYPDVCELFLAADVLVTDYSSVMFDFAVTGKPIVLYASDFERFRDEVRGFYFDLVGSAPGPVARTSEELAAVLHDLPAGQVRHRTAYADFRARFCSLEDGQATDRLLALLAKRGAL